ncbi:MAG TPA: hypothetical protein VF041_23195 [Gemmatimonadaceae bacterium]
MFQRTDQGDHCRFGGRVGDALTIYVPSHRTHPGHAWPVRVNVDGTGEHCPCPAVGTCRHILIAQDAAVTYLGLLRNYRAMTPAQRLAHLREAGPARVGFPTIQYAALMRAIADGGDAGQEARAA